MIKKTCVNNYDYDLQADSVFFYSSGKNYMSSIEFEGIIIDLSKDNDVINLEVLDASKRFHVSKTELLKIKHFDADIDISPENIKVSMNLEIVKRNTVSSKFMEAITANILNLPSSTKGIAMTC